MDYTWLWIPATLAAAAFQFGRNVVQRNLTETLGTLGATQVRFLFGFPFAIILFALVVTFVGSAPPAVNGRYLAFVAGGALSQITATALMLAAMRERNFLVVTAWTKTEPLQVAVFGFAVLGDPLSMGGFAAILLATLGVALMSKPAGATASLTPTWRPVLLGIVSGAFFALSAIGFRGAILALGEGPFVLHASWALIWGLGLQTLLLLGWMVFFNRRLLVACFRAWRPSLPGGLLGALASQFWFIGFSLTSAANVRTLGLVEILFAQLLSRRLLSETSSSREILGVVLVLGGVGWLLWLQR